MKLALLRVDEVNKPPFISESGVETYLVEKAVLGISLALRK
jgi:hypothetical protein